MKFNLFYGLFGCSGDGVLCTPSGRQAIKLPGCIVFKLHTFINKFAYTGMKNTKLIFEKGI